MLKKNEMQMLAVVLQLYDYQEDHGLGFYTPVSAIVC